MPATAAQRAALDSQADILLFGGSAGSLKTETMLMDAVQEYQNPNLRAIVFRSSFVEMTDIIDKTRRLYAPMGGVFVGSPKWTWSFPSGATIRFAYMKTDDDVWKYLGPPLLLHRLRRINPAHRETSPQHTGPLERHRSRPAPAHAPHLEPRQRRRRLASDLSFCAATARSTTNATRRNPANSTAIAAGPPMAKPFPSPWPSSPANSPTTTSLDANYAKRLHMMSGGAAAAMEQGCWCTLEGAYFPFVHAGMVRPLAEAGVEWWHNHFLSIDYGYGKSSSSVGLYVRGPAELQPEDRDPRRRVAACCAQHDGPEFPQGRIRKIGELVVPHVPAYELAEMVVDAFIRPEENGERRRIVAAYLDPANFKEIGDGHTIADQINEVLRALGNHLRAGLERPPGRLATVVSHAAHRRVRNYRRVPAHLRSPAHAHARRQPGPETYARSPVTRSTTSPTKPATPSTPSCSRRRSRAS